MVPDVDMKMKSSDFLQGNSQSNFSSFVKKSKQLAEVEKEQQRIEVLTKCSS